jgi:hypothetical protein
MRCQARTPFYFRTRFTRTTAHELENRLQDPKMKQNLIPVNRKLTDSQKRSSSEPKLPRTVMAAISVPKEPANILPHSTCLD